MKVLPARLLLILLALAAPLFLLSPAVALLVDAVLIAAAVVDGRLAAPASFRMRRVSPGRLSLGSIGSVEIEVENRSRHTLRVQITDDLSPQLHRIGWDGGGPAASGGPSNRGGVAPWKPAREAPDPAPAPERSTTAADEPPGVPPELSDGAWAGRAAPEGPEAAPERPESSPDAAAMRIPPGRPVRLRYRFRASERGTATLGNLHLRVLGPLGLVWRQRREVRSDPVRVQPGLRELRRYRLLAHRHRLREMGLRTMAERGEGSSFESLREYVRGDDPRRLDWKASAKRDTLVVRQTEVERSQNVLLAIDAGRLMTEELGAADVAGGGRERLDAALSAALLLAEVAAQHGDRVGLLVFSDRVEQFIPPARLPLKRLAEPLAEVQARLVEPDYPGAFAFLAQQLRRRSLVVLFTDVIDARASAALLAHAGAATRRHLPLAVAIRNPLLEEIAAAPAVDETAVYRRAAAEELLQLRGVALATMRRAGVLVADTVPGDAVPTAVNRYLEVKRRGRV